ncbi:dihydrolipoamide acetyltransferase family protein [Rhodococcus sp. APC 3903]|uniref:dihydrolipoamide acetyltransferase family protein n=1 Tax=Rhodococcus sp. APC 3903 TaxID=3035193 RepID=UPI0025B4F18D|nr:dihydrolipoamide acetyltransferase family protein [Rhodococcus sp. APC 3903]
MPEVAAGATTVILSEWPLAVDSEFDVDEPLAVLETDKATVEIEAESAGVLVHTFVEPGTSVEVGAPIAVLADRGEVVKDIAALLAELGVRDAHGCSAKPETSNAVDEPDGTSPPTVPGEKVADERAPRIFASPLARRLAESAGLNLGDIVGSGPNGRVVRNDVDAAIAVKGASAQAVAVKDVGVKDAGVKGHGSAFTDTPHTRLRRAIAARLTSSKQTQPHFYISGSARVDALLEARRQLNEVSASKVSVNDLLIKAMAKAHTLVPEMNSIWVEDAVRTFAKVDISIAIDSDRGLLTPVLRGVDAMSISEIASATKDLVARAGAGKIRQDELEGGSTTISNLGMFGVEEFSAIINPPQSSILAIGAATEQPVVVAGRLEVGTVLRVILSVDHRPIDGAIAAKWMKHFTTVLENPIQIFG